MKTVLTSRIPKVKREVAKELQKRLASAARDCRKYVADQLDSGALPIHSDTHALAKSLFVQTPTGSDYATRLGAAAAAYISGASKWQDAVRDAVDGTAYSPEHFAERVAPEEPLNKGNATAAAAVGTMLAWGLWWELGHKNIFTTKDEPARAWLETTATAWVMANLEGYFANLV